MKRIFQFVLFMVVGLTVNAISAYRVKHIGLKEGLSNSFVNDIVEDNMGFIWVATESGLNRIAGVNVTQFKKNGCGLSTDAIFQLYFYPDASELWMALRYGGIDVYDTVTGVFRNINKANGLLSDVVRDIKPAYDGTGIWILHYDGSVQYYDFRNRSFTNFPYILDAGARTITDDGNGYIYIGHSTKGLYIYDLKKGSMRNYRSVNDGSRDGLPGNNVRNITLDKKKNIWIGSNAGLSLFNPVTERFITFNQGLAGNNVFDINENGLLWVSSDLGGISVVDLDGFSGQATDCLDVVATFSPDNSELSSPNVRKVIHDGYGNVWVANYCTGIDVLTVSNGFSTVSSFSNLNGKEVADKHYGITTDANGDVWLGGENELTMIHDNEVVFQTKIKPSGDRSEALVTSLMADADGNIWLGMNDAGVMLYDPVRNIFKTIDLGEDMLDVHAFWQDADGKVWIGSENGLFSYCDGTVVKETQYTSGTIYSILRTDNGNMWIGTNGGGIDVYDNCGNFVRHQDCLPTGHINHIVVDGNNDVWAGTYEGVCHITDSVVRVYDDRNGLLDNNARALAIDRSGNMWVSTYSGISRIDRKTGAIYNYNYEDGVPPGGFVEGAVTTLHDGTLMFSSPNGVCYFNPQLVSGEYMVSQIEIIDCEKLNANSYKISFTVRDFSQTGQVEYAYILDGLNDDWHTTDGESYRSIRDIPPGNYIFKVKARWKNGQWDDTNIASVPIVVEPPVWATRWAFAVYAVIIVTVCCLLVWLYKRHLKQKNLLELQRNMLEIEKKQRHDEVELNVERLRFYTNIAHEIRTPLTLIIGPLEDLMNDSGMPAKYNRRVNIIHHSALRLLNLINQIMEFRKTETSNRQLFVAKGNIGILVKEIGMKYKELNRNVNLAIVFDINGTPDIYFDSEVISTILDNLLSNAVKYTPCGVIRLTVKVLESEKVLVEVSDTGYGIEQAAIPHIFDRYYQVHGKHQASGTGIGLALVKSLAELHHATISVVSELGEGTTFSLCLPVDDSYPEARHREEISPDPEAVMSQTADSDSRPVVLVVEDNDDIRSYIVDTLCDVYNVIVGRNGKEGLDAAVSNIPDIILSDVMMPELDGIDMCRLLKADIRTSHIPVVLLTAKDSLSDKETGYESGADSYLTKPFTAKLLRNRISNLLIARSKLARYIIDKSRGMKHVDCVSSCDDSFSSMPKLSQLDEEFLDRFTKLVESNLDSEKLNMDFITGKLNMSYSSFYRKIKALTGITANEFIRKIKLRNSVRLMLSGKYNISETAMMTGFNNLGHFREAFKDEYGCTPSQYMKRYM